MQATTDSSAVMGKRGGSKLMAEWMFSSVDWLVGSDRRVFIAIISLSAIGAGVVAFGSWWRAKRAERPDVDNLIS